MVPRTITSGLASLRWRERLLQLAWGGALIVGALVAWLLVGGLIDWLIDRDMETPWALRIAMAVMGLLVLATIATIALVLPMLRRLPDDALALRVEQAHRRLHERLISA